MNLMFSNAFKSDEFNLLLCNFALLLLSQISSYSLLFVFAIIRKFNKKIAKMFGNDMIFCERLQVLVRSFLATSFELRAMSNK